MDDEAADDGVGGEAAHGPPVEGIVAGLAGGVGPVADPGTIGIDDGDVGDGADVINETNDTNGTVDTLRLTDLAAAAVSELARGPLAQPCDEELSDLVVVDSIRVFI